MSKIGQVTFLLAVSVLSVSMLLAQGGFQALEQAVKLIEHDNIMNAAEELDLEPEAIFLATDISTDGRYMRYELAGEEGFHEARLITNRQDTGVLVCTVSSACGPVCEQDALQCYQILGDTVNEVTGDVLPENLAEFLAAKINALHERAETNAPDENEPCPYLERIILPRDSRDATIKLGYVCGYQPEESVVELAVLEYRNGRFILRELR